MTLLALAIVGVVVWSGWEQIAVYMAPEKQPAKVRSEAATKADDPSWQTFHNGDYERIQNALDVLTAGYGSPRGCEDRSSHCVVHMWRVSQRQRLGQARLPLPKT